MHTTKKSASRHVLFEEQGSALILVVLLTLVLSAMSVVALRDIARTTSATSVYRTRTQAQMASDASVRIFTNFAGRQADQLFQAGLASMHDDGASVEGSFGSSTDIGIDIDNDGNVTWEEERRTLAVRGPVLILDDELLTSDCGGSCEQMLTSPGGDETGLFRNNVTDLTFESQRTTDWSIVMRDFVDGYPAVGYGEGYCFKKALSASQARVGEVDQNWNNANNVGFSRHGMDTMLGPVPCGYN